MGSRLKTQCLLGLAVALCLQGGGPAQAASGQAESQGRRVHIRTVDFVELQGTFYPAARDRRDTCVLLLHDVHPGNGGSSRDEPWDDFAANLQQAGFDVLSFDFRGFGESTRVAEEFWDRGRFPFNQLIRGAARKPSSIHVEDFPSQYFPNLANDVAAARAFLDRCSDRGEVNSSNLVVVGAGEGATLGLMWMAAECRLQRDRASDQPLPLRHQLDEPEGQDLACGVWLNISSVLAGRRVPLLKLLKDVTQKGKVRTVLLASKTAASAAKIVQYAEAANRGQKKRMAIARVIPGMNKQPARMMLADRDIARWIVEDCLKNVLDVRGTREARKHEAEKYSYYWAFPWPGQPAARFIPAKVHGESLLRPVPIHLLLNR